MTQYAVVISSENTALVTWPNLILNQGYSNQDDIVGIVNDASSNTMMQWTDKLDGNTTATLQLNDNSNIKSPSTQGNHVLVCRFETQTIYDLLPPPAGITTGFTLNVRMRKDLASGGQVDGLLEIRQDYVSESSLGTLICEIQQTDVTPAFTDFSHTLSAGEVGAITNYQNLFIRIVTTSL